MPFSEVKYDDRIIAVTFYMILLAFDARAFNWSISFILVQFSFDHRHKLAGDMRTVCELSNHVDTFERWNHAAVQICE